MADVRFIRESLHLQYSACPLSAKSGHRQLGKIVSKTRLRVETSGHSADSQLRSGFRS